MEYIHKCPIRDKDGIELVQWIASSTGYCIYSYDPLTTLSTFSGYVSMVCWLGAQLPQVVVNYMNQSVEGLSLGFLLNWFAGDATNFFGCLLTGQMAFQTILAGYYMCIDLILGSQYIYYSRLDRQRHERHRRMYYDRQVDSPAPDDRDTKTTTTTPVNVPQSGSGTSSTTSTSAAKNSRDFQSSPAATRNGTTSSNKLLTSSFVASFAKFASSAPLPDGAVSPQTASFIADFGRVLAWICTFMYLTSRIPQIVKNFRRKSTWGTSMLLFMSALVGNVTYTISILCSPQARGSGSAMFLQNELPYLIGSAGTVLFDLTIFLQFLYFGNKQTHPDSPPLLPSSGIADDYDNDYNDHPHHQYPDLSLIPPITHSAFKPIASNHAHHPNAVDDGGIDASTPLALSYQKNYQTNARDMSYSSTMGSR